MKYYSTSNRDLFAPTSREAVLNGLAPDGGLYMPTELPRFDAARMQQLATEGLHSIGFTIAKVFFGDEISEADLLQIVQRSFSFEVPLVRLKPLGFYAAEKPISILELFHGPTLAFKDFGARFMARLIAQLRRNENRELTILVATSGDTGGAVASGFLNVKGTKAIILFPTGKVSALQRKQFTSLGNNITALEVDGNFDDCQRLVKEALVDPLLRARLNLGSANSINIARLIPQMFYYVHGYAQRKHPQLPLLFCVPSGNFGNLTAGLFAKQMGLPIEQFIAATNSNSVIPEYLNTGDFIPRASVATISNAMDVGNPSNFARMDALEKMTRTKLSSYISGACITDAETLATISAVDKNSGYLLDPHSAVGYRALSLVREPRPYEAILLGTAHPAKFRESIEPVIGRQIELPAELRALIDKPEKTVKLSNRIEDLRAYLLS